MNLEKPNATVKWAAETAVPSETVVTAAPLERLVGLGTSLTSWELLLNSIDTKLDKQFKSAKAKMTSVEISVFYNPTSNELYGKFGNTSIPKEGVGFLIELTDATIDPDKAEVLRQYCYWRLIVLSGCKTPSC